MDNKGILYRIYQTKGFVWLTPNTDNWVDETGLWAGNLEDMIARVLDMKGTLLGNHIDGKGIPYIGVTSDTLLY